MSKTMKSRPCAAKNCGANKRNFNTISFFRFPKDTERSVKLIYETTTK